MTNPFVDKAQKRNPFIEKAQEAQIQTRAKEIAETNYRALQDIFDRYDKNDRSEARERIRLRVIEAREAVESLG